MLLVLAENMHEHCCNDSYNNQPSSHNLSKIHLPLWEFRDTPSVAKGKHDSDMQQHANQPQWMTIRV